MASGPQHYAAAEQALAKAKDIPTESPEFGRWIQIASIHIQAAQAAATFDAVNLDGQTSTAAAWRDATYPTKDGI